MELYVFPLGNVLLYPSASKPLHIFEPRYIQMVEDAIRTNTCIAIGYVDEPGREHLYRPGEYLSFVRSVVGFGKPLVVERRTDGSILIFLQGQGKARLGKTIARDLPYIVCDAEKIDENHSLSPLEYARFSITQRVLMNWLDSNVFDPQTREQFVNLIRTPEDVVGCYASYLVADQDFQQMILEIDDINEKIRFIHRLIYSGEIAGPFSEHG